MALASGILAGNEDRRGYIYHIRRRARVPAQRMRWPRLRSPRPPSSCLNGTRREPPSRKSRASSKDPTSFTATSRSSSLSESIPGAPANVFRTTQQPPREIPERLISLSLFCMISIGIPVRFITCIRLITPHIPAFTISPGKQFKIWARRASFNNWNQLIRFS